MMRRTIFEDDHKLYRRAVREFIQAEIAPHHAAWEDAGVVSRAAWEAAGAGGHLGHAVPEEYGGAGVDDFRFPVVFMEEMADALASGPGFAVHSEMVVPYITAYASPEQKQRWLPGCVEGSIITAVAMSEPGTGSDLAGIATKAVRDDDWYVLNGAKIFISNGQLADLVVVVARTADDPHRGLSLLVVERGMEGFERGRNLDKVGMKAQDTSELFFNDVRVSVDNLIGEEGAGFIYLMSGLDSDSVRGCACWMWAVAGEAWSCTRSRTTGSPRSASLCRHNKRSGVSRRLPMQGSRGRPRFASATTATCRNQNLTPSRPSDSPNTSAARTIRRTSLSSTARFVKRVGCLTTPSLDPTTTSRLTTERVSSTGTSSQTENCPGPATS